MLKIWQAIGELPEGEIRHLVELQAPKLRAALGQSPHFSTPNVPALIETPLTTIIAHAEVRLTLQVLRISSKGVEARARFQVVMSERVRLRVQRQLAAKQ